MNAQIPKDSFELMRQLRKYEKIDNSNLQLQQKQNRTKKQELVREAIEKRLLESEDYTFSEEGLRRTRAYEDRIKMENEDILSLRIETKLRETKKDEFRKKIRIEAELRRQKEVEDREARKKLAEERRKVVVERIRKKQEEEERKLKEAELEKNRIVEENERKKREGEERIRLNRSKMLHEDDLSKLYEQDYKDEVERKIWLQKQAESINAWEILQKQKDFEEQQEQALRLQELELKKLKLIEMRKLQENKSKSVDAIALAREEAEKLNRQLRIQNKAKFVSKKMKTEKLTIEVEIKEKSVIDNASNNIAQVVVQNGSLSNTDGSDVIAIATTNSTNTNKSFSISTATGGGLSLLPTLPLLSSPSLSSTTATATATAIKEGAGAGGSEAMIIPPAFIQQINALSSETELRALEKTLMEEKRLLRLGNYHTKSEGNEAVPETNSIPDYQTEINNRIKIINLQEVAIENRINNILTREGNKGGLSNSGGCATTNINTITSSAKAPSREVVKPINVTNAIKPVAPAPTVISDSIIAAKSSANNSNGSSNNSQLQNNTGDQLFKKAEELLYDAQEILRNNNTVEQQAYLRKLGLLEMEIQNVINKLVNIVDPVGYTAKLKDAKRKLKAQKEQLILMSQSPSITTSATTSTTVIVPDKSVTNSLHKPLIEDTTAESTNLLKQGHKANIIDINSKVIAVPTSVLPVTPLSMTTIPSSSTVSPIIPPPSPSRAVVGVAGGYKELPRVNKDKAELESDTVTEAVSVKVSNEAEGRPKEEVINSSVLDYKEIEEQVTAVIPVNQSNLTTTSLPLKTESNGTTDTGTTSLNAHSNIQITETIASNGPLTSSLSIDNYTNYGNSSKEITPAIISSIPTPTSTQSPRMIQNNSCLVSSSTSNSSRPCTPVKLVLALKQASSVHYENLNSITSNTNTNIVPNSDSDVVMVSRRVSVGVILPPLPTAAAAFGTTSTASQPNSVRRVSKDKNIVNLPLSNSTSNSESNNKINSTKNSFINKSNNILQGHSIISTNLLTTQSPSTQQLNRSLIRPPSVQDLQTHSAIKSLSTASSGLNIAVDSNELIKSKSFLNAKQRQSLINFEALIEAESLLEGIEDIKTVQEDDDLDDNTQLITSNKTEELYGDNNIDNIVEEEEEVDFEKLPGWTECMHTSMASAAHHAAFYGYDLVLETLGRYFDVFVLDDKNRTPLFYAALRNHLNCVTALVSIDAQWIDVGDINGDTPLHAAAISNGVDVLEFLLSCECNPDIANYEGYTPSHLAKTDSALATLHRAGAILYCMDSRSRLPLWLACKEGRAECVHFLCSVTPSHFLMWGDDEGDSCIHVAAMEGFHKVVEVICQWISSVEDLYVVNNKKYTAAHVAATSTVLQKLYENGAELWIRDPKGRYPLFFASFYGRVDCVAFLLEIANIKNVDVISAPDNVGDTALHAACLRGHLQCALLLLYFIRDVPNAGGLLASQLASRAGHRHLAKVVAHVEGKKVNGMTADEIFGCTFEHMSAVIYYHGSRWIKLYDHSSCLLYYYDRATSCSQWERPEQYDENPVDESDSDKARFILIRFYTQYNPDKLRDIDEIMMAYKGNFIQLFLQLAERYNAQDLSMFAGVLDDNKSN